MTLEKPRILIVDDEKDLREALCDSLQEEYDVMAVKSGAEAIALFKEKPFDLVITDFNMPDMSGVDVCSEIKKHTKESYVPVILLTGMSDEEHELEGFGAGADDFLAKPFSVLVLRAKCKVMIRIKALHDKLETLNSDLGVTVNNQVQELRKINQLRKYFSPHMIKQLVDSDEANTFGAIPIRRTVTILFCDIRNFSKLSDDMDPLKVKGLLDEYLSLVTRSVFKWGGTVNKFMGDGALVLFGDLGATSSQCLDAINAALEIKSEVHKLAQRLPENLRDLFKVGVGINTGAVVLGNVGSGEHVDYTVVGSAVNMAARLQAFSSNNNIIITKESIEKIKDKVDVGNDRSEVIKGFSEKIPICEVFGVKK